MGIEGKNSNQSVVLSETSAKAFLCLLYNSALFRPPGLSRETSIRFADKIDEVYFVKRCCYLTGTLDVNGLLKNDFDVVNKITGRFAEELRGKSVPGMVSDLDLLQGKAIILSIDIVRQSARRLPLGAREEYASLLYRLPDNVVKGLMLYKYHIVNADCRLIQKLGDDFAELLRKPSRSYP